VSAPLVLKFGGTSLGTPARIRRAAERVAALHRAGRDVVAVVSARGHTTDRILKDLGRLGAENAAAARRETDRVLATGEDLSAGLLAATLNGLGIPARSLRGGEAGIRADGDFGTGRIREVDPARLTELLSAGIVPVVSGFQGERSDRETVTLGRGGSDTSAVAIAAALGSAPCDIVTDVDAVYDRDPRRDPSARAFAELTHEELLELAVGGAQVVHPEAARLAQRHEVPLRVYAYSAPVSGPSRSTRVVPGRRLPRAEARRKAS
jgi:aspartate kinase